jgi:hypothetical protein
MRETNKMLKDAQLSKAETEVRNSSRSWSTSAVFCSPRTRLQLKLARLRQMRGRLATLNGSSGRAARLAVALATSNASASSD